MHYDYQPLYGLREFLSICAYSCAQGERLRWPGSTVLDDGAFGNDEVNDTEVNSTIVGLTANTIVAGATFPNIKTPIAV